MPAFKNYTANIQGAPISGGRRATPEDMGAVDLSGIAHAVQGAANQFIAVRERDAAEAERQRKIQEAQAARDAALRGAKVVAFGRGDFVSYLEQAGQKPMSELPDVVEDFNQKFQDFRDKALEQEQHPEGRQKLEIDLENMRVGLVDNAMRLQAQRAGLAAKTTLRDVFNQNAIVAQKDPAQLERLLGQERQLIADLQIPGLTDKQRAQLYDDRRYVLPGAAVGARIAAVNTSREATSLKAELEGNKRWQELLSGEQYARAINSLTKDIKTFQRAERSAYIEHLRERVDEAAAGVPNGLSVNEAGGDPKLTRAITSALAIGAARQSIKAVPFSDMLGMLRDAQDKLAKPGDYNTDRAYAEAVQHAAAERTRALSQDPAGYAVQTVDPVKKAYDAMVNSKFEAGAVKWYATVSAQAQRDLGGPGFSPKLLPKSQADQVIAEVGSLPPEQVANRMESLRKQYGPMWGEVLQQAYGKLPPGYTTLGRLDTAADAHVRVDLANALKSGADLRKNIADADAKETDNRVDEALRPYASVISQAGPGAQTVLREELAAARALAYQAVARGESPRTAAKNAANSLIFDRYETGTTFLAPKGQLGLAQREASRTMQSVSDADFLPAPGGDPSLSDDYRRKATADAARRGYWANVTVDNRLGIEWRSADGTPVALTDGEPVRLFFDELRSTPNAPRRGALPRGFGATPGGAATVSP